MIKKISFLTKNEYNRIWKDWFLESHKKATIEIILLTESDICKAEPAESGYDNVNDKIIIRLAPADVEDYEINSESSLWPSWKTELVHEMIHELTFKAPNNIIVVDNWEEIKRKKKFDGTGHNELFYSAIANKAQYFDKTLEGFLFQL